MSHSSSRRPGPLQELPLARFLPVEPKLVSNPFKCTPKRPRSPGTPVGLLSPVKKRILREEKFFAHPEPVKAPSWGSLPEFKSGARSSTTPSRKLDLGSPSLSSSSRPAREDDQARVTRQTRRSSVPNRISSPVFLHPRSVERVAPSSTEARDAETSSSEPFTSTTPLMIPRELPEVSDLQSIHYPGFDIHIDTHIEIPSTRRRDASPQSDSDSAKENMPPRKKAKKTMFAPSDLQTGEGNSAAKSADASCVGQMIGSPVSKHQRLLPVDRTPVRTPKQSHYARLTSPGFTPGRTPVVSRNAQLERRKALEDEVDLPDDETSGEASDA